MRRGHVEKHTIEGSLWQSQREGKVPSLASPPMLRDPNLQIFPQALQNAYICTGAGDP